MQAVTLAELKASIPADDFARACHEAWHRADGPSPDAAFDLVHHARRNTTNDVERTDLLLALYHEMPCYHIMASLKEEHRSLSDAGRSRLWAGFRNVLAQPDDRLAHSLLYALSVDFLEDGATVREAWDALTQRPLSPRAMGRVVASAGAVPWDLKSALFHEAADHPDLHAQVAEGIADSLFSACGDVDVAEAREVFLRLDLLPDHPGLENLERAFGTYERG